MDQQQQRALFYESYRAALREDCKAIDGTPAWAKVVGQRLFPEISDPVEAGRRLNDKTNPNRDDRLSDDQERLIMRLAREKRGFSAALDYICDDTEFERTKPKDRKDEMLELQGRIERSTSELRSLIERQERLVRSPLTDVSSRKQA
jgi:hypothetical protein